ncbi:hypothetical protein Mal64_38550 [Pseudobythopirellula maris]|uniref:Uncharacterized protein n=1 Tax=Pseudobythopirellula maris TaxID=2527991 RepID=A0A5C5ZGS5_9BACT|nr:hypothetical protein [Pseudobythopirellula maris]TWT86315.1 hypothetical protein Mal64_38550 [Pseudobythopirellula maris]
MRTSTQEISLRRSSRADAVRKAHRLVAQSTHEGHSPEALDEAFASETFAPSDAKPHAGLGALPELPAQASGPEDDTLEQIRAQLRAIDGQRAELDRLLSRYRRLNAPTGASRTAGASL